MELPMFNYKQAGSLEEAGQLLREYQGRARPLAGGTELLPRMKYGLDKPEVLIGIKGVSYRPPRITSEGRLSLDALITLDAMRQSPELGEKLPVLTDAARAVASKEIRVMGTLGGNICQDSRCLYYNQSHRYQFVEPCFKRGGNLCYFIPKGSRCWAVYMADTAPALMSLDANVIIYDGVKERTLPLEELYRNDPLQPLSLVPGELLSRISITGAHAKVAGAYRKFTMRGALEFAAVGVAVTLELEPGSYVCRKARIVVGAVGPTPVRGKETEKLLTGETLKDGLLAEAAGRLAAEIRVVPHHGYSAQYLKAVIKSIGKEALSKALERGTGGQRKGK
ncbi:MAG: FAD binding domain-containing protein [Desulfobacteraceae bacterium]